MKTRINVAFKKTFLITYYILFPLSLRSTEPVSPPQPVPSSIANDSRDRQKRMKADSKRDRKQIASTEFMNKMSRVKYCVGPTRAHGRFYN